MRERDRERQTDRPTGKRRERQRVRERENDLIAAPPKLCKPHCIPLAILIIIYNYLTLSESPPYITTGITRP